MTTTNLLSVFAVILFSLMSCNSQKQNIDSSSSNSIIEQNFYEYSGIRETENTLIKDQKTWEKFNSALFEGQSPKPEIEKIDFSKYSIAVFAFGERSHGGFTCTAVDYEQKNNVLIFQLETPKRDPMSPATMALTQPVLICKIPMTTASELSYSMESK